MKKYTFFLALCISLASYAQYEITIKATLIDKSNNQPVSYANIGFFNKSIGTVSNEEGIFELVYDEDLVSDSEIFQISSLGYKPINTSLGDLKKLLNNTNKIYLESKTETLTEVLLSNETRKDVEIGSAKLNKDLLGYWKDKQALGGEIANKINIKRKNTRLKNFKFYVVENQADSIKIRVNIYKYSKGYPTEKILKENVYHTVKIKLGEVSIDLEPYNIMVNEDFVIGFELIKVYGDVIAFAISGSQYSGPAFKRYVSQDKWERHPEVGMSFSVLTSIPTSKGNNDIVERPIPEKITLYWDVSIFRDQKNINKELELLSSYLKSLKNVNVQVIKFNNDTSTKRDFLVNKRNLKDLITYLQTSTYYGGLDYNVILKNNEFGADAVLLFTNGASLFSELNSEINAPIFSINSSTKANHEVLQKAAYSADGHYVNLVTTTLDDGLKSMTNDVLDTNDYSVINVDPIQGKVVNSNGPIQGAIIRVKNTLNEVETDANGYYKINALDGDDLVIDALGMLPKEVVATKASVMNIMLEAEGELLDVVEVVDNNSKKEIVNTASGKKNKNAVGVGTQSLSAEDFPKTAVYLVDIIRGRFAGVRTQGIGPDAKFFIRGINSIVQPVPAAFEVNGMIFRDAPSFINPQQIQSITLLSSLAATNRYGSLGRGGIFKIELKGYRKDGENGKPIDRALVTGNDYDENLKILIPDAIKSKARLKLEQSISYQDALDKYYTLLIGMSSSSRISFNIEASDYFKRWDTSLPQALLEKAALKAYNNPKALKTIAYKLEEEENYNAAKIVYERIALLKPKAIQSYRDLALIYMYSGEYSASMRLYKKILNNRIQDLDFSPLATTITNEIKNLVAKHRIHVNYKDLDPDLLSTKFNIDLRIVFEWNDPNVEFDIQFVNPQKKYFTWSHTLFDNQDRLIDEVKNGYNTQEFAIDDAESGEWIINIKCFGDKPQLNPTFLKYTVYKNYGLKNETREIKVIKLDEQTEKVTLDKFAY